MEEKVSTPWDGNWQLRLQRKLDSLGFADLDEYLEAHPGIGYLDIAKSLGDANIAAMQIYGLQIRTAAETGRLRAAAADSLSRFLVQHVKRGWGRGYHFAGNVAAAFGDWKVVLGRYSGTGRAFKERLDAITKTVRASNPPEGWIPSGRDDEILRRAFDECWPAGRQ